MCLENHVWIFICTLFKFYFPAIHCPSVEGILSDHMTYRLLSGRLGEFGSMVMLECSTGYYLGVGHRSLRCLANGTWDGSDDPATCKSKYLYKHDYHRDFVAQNNSKLLLSGFFCSDSSDPFPSEQDNKTPVWYYIVCAWSPPSALKVTHNFIYDSRTKPTLGFFIMRESF